MHPISLQEVATMAQGMLIKGAPTTSIHSVHFDTRLLSTASLFIPIKGEVRDGHDFLLAAAEKGAQAALISNRTRIPQGMPENFGFILVNDTLRAFQKLAEAYRSRFDIPFIAVTGSNGKTTTKDMIAHLLGAKLPLYKTFTNLNNHLGVPFSLLQIDESHETAVLELGMNHAGEIDLLASLVKPQVSVITNIGDAHIEFFGTREKIALAKAELLPHNRPNGLVLLNGDNEYLCEVSHLANGTVLFYSVEGEADIWADNISSTEEGTHFTVYLDSGESFDACMPLFGTYNVSNALPAIAIARYFGLSIEEIKRALASVHVSGMRFEVVHTASRALLINDAYNASPYSMKTALETFAGIFSSHKKVVVLGDIFELGEDSKELHASVGEFANRFLHQFELLITVGNHSRYLHEKYEGKKLHVNTKEEALPILSPFVDERHAILFKASRGMKLDTLLDSLKK